MTWRNAEQFELKRTAMILRAHFEDLVKYADSHRFAPTSVVRARLESLVNSYAIWLGQVQSARTEFGSEFDGEMQAVYSSIITLQRILADRGSLLSGILRVLQVLAQGIDSILGLMGLAPKVMPLLGAVQNLVPMLAPPPTIGGAGSYPFSLSGPPQLHTLSEGYGSHHSESPRLLAPPIGPYIPTSAEGYGAPRSPSASTSTANQSGHDLEGLFIAMVEGTIVFGFSLALLVFIVLGVVGIIIGRAGDDSYDVVWAIAAGLCLPLGASVGLILELKERK